MYYKNLCFVTIALLVICNHVNGKKIKRNKRPKEQEEATTIQPNVVAYSTFGFNDVGSYDGFVPTSPEYSSFLSGANQESSTRLYAPAFPSAADTTGFGGNYGTSSNNGHILNVSDDEGGQSGISQYPSNSLNFISSSNFINRERNKNIDSDNTSNQNREDLNKPVYGTKINSRHKNRPVYPNSNNEIDIQNNEYSNPSKDNYFNFQGTEHFHQKPELSDLNTDYKSISSYSPNTVVQSEYFGKPEISNLNFPRVVDFTNLSNKHYPTDLDTSKLTSDNTQHLGPHISMENSQIDNNFSNSYSSFKNIDNSPPRLADNYNIINNEEQNKNVLTSNTFFQPDFTEKHVAAHYKQVEYIPKKPDQKKKNKSKTLGSGNYSNADNDWKDTSLSSVKGYGYSTNYSNMNFRYGVSEPKKTFSSDETEPASSNVVDLNAYTFPGTDYNNFKKMPKFNNYEEYFERPQYKEKFKSGDYLNQFGGAHNDVKTTTSSWGNTFKATDFSSSGDHHKKPTITEIIHDKVVNIPRRPHKLRYNKNKEVDWPSNYYGPQNIYKPAHDWTKDFVDTKYKSEEDLLGLRTHDTSHPSYIPTYKPNNNYDNDEEFKQLVEKWKESYLRSKHKDYENVRDYESYQVKPYHVPIPKPYPIEVPHPVIVPVPRPFPVRVPISRPVAVPVVRELTVPIEKPVPYPVYKDVPYPVEKPVPVLIEKEVSVPVEKPYPVHIPHIQPVFHHTKPVHEDSEHLDEDDYARRPEYKKPSHYKKRPVYGSRSKPRRPSRTSYQDRNRRRSPEHHRPSSYNPEYRHSSKSKGLKHSPYRHSTFEHEVDDDEHEYRIYCKNPGNC